MLQLKSKLTGASEAELAGLVFTDHVKTAFLMMRFNIIVKCFVIAFAKTGNVLEI